MSIVVTGATGHLGQLVVEGLLQALPSDQVVACVRDPKKASWLSTRGVQIRVADYDRPESLAAAFQHGDRVLLISGVELGKRVHQHRAVVDAARAAGVAQLAYTSILGGPRADFTLGRDHQETEQIIMRSGLSYVLLRNGFYTESYLDGLTETLERGEISGNAAAGRVASASRSDLAAAAVAVLTQDVRKSSVYELAGNTAWTFTDLAGEISRQSGTTVTYRNYAAGARRTRLIETGLPDDIAELLVDIDDAIARGLLGETRTDLSTLIGRPSTPMAHSISEALRAV